jgi:hypothetical protein
MNVQRFDFRGVASFLLRLTEAGGDPGIFCYRMGMDILSADNGRFLAPANAMADLLRRSFAISKRNQVACSNLFSTFFARFSTLKD